MNKRITSDSNGAEGYNISAKTEIRCGGELLKLLPKGWTINFHWMQFSMQDVGYEVNKSKKHIEIGYNKNLSNWWGEVTKDILAIVR